MSASIAFRVEDLAPDERVCLRCACLVRTFTRAQLVGLVGRDARLDRLDLYPELHCTGCGELPDRGWVAGPPARPAPDAVGGALLRWRAAYLDGDDVG